MLETTKHLRMAQWGGGGGEGAEQWQGSYEKVLGEPSGHWAGEGCSALRFWLVCEASSSYLPGGCRREILFLHTESSGWRRPAIFMELHLKDKNAWECNKLKRKHSVCDAVTWPLLGIKERAGPREESGCFHRLPASPSWAAGVALPLFCSH